MKTGTCEKGNSCNYAHDNAQPVPNAAKGKGKNQKGGK